MTDKLYLSLVFHNHQPVGNFSFVFEEAYTRAYDPLLSALERHPGVRVTMHWSGPLRDWLHANRPEFLQRVRTLVGRKQIEPLGGGYYEPVLVALPDADKIGQLVKLSEAVMEDFGVRPKGAWLAERVWEAHLPSFLVEAGLAHTLLDDTHFLHSGFTPDELYGYYVTEDQGRAVKVFSSSQHLRHSVPWSPVDQVIDGLRALADRPLPPGAPARLVALGEDGEKFGLWPGTFDICWGEDGGPGWIEAFFTALENQADWLTLLTLDDAARILPPLGRAYLATSAYEEMIEWSLPAPRAQELHALREQLQQAGREDVLRFVNVGTWRSFMAKYPEVNTLHKKIVYTSGKAHQIRKSGPRAKALDELWASQCNCPYWHGVFGGVYLFHIREAAAAHLIEAGTLAARALHAAETWVEAVTGDIDCDGFDETLLSTDTQELMAAPGQGGTLVAWDWRATNVNLLNVLSRRPEAYHRDLIEAANNGTLVIAGQPLRFGASRTIRAKEEGLEKRLVYDLYRRASLIDHVFVPGATLDDFRLCAFGEVGDFVGHPYTARTSKVRGGVILSMARDGSVRIGGRAQPLRIEKKIEVKPGDSGLTVDYILTNPGDDPLSARFGVETNWGMSGGDSSEGAYTVWPGGTLERLNATTETIGVKEMAIVHEGVGRVILRTDDDGTWWQFPIETVSNSEAGFERVYQGTAVMAHWPLELEPGATWKLSLTFVLVPSRGET